MHVAQLSIAQICWMPANLSCCLSKRGLYMGKLNSQLVVLVDAYPITLINACALAFRSSSAFLVISSICVLLTLD